MRTSDAVSSFPLLLPLPVPPHPLELVVDVGEILLTIGGASDWLRFWLRTIGSTTPQLLPFKPITGFWLVSVVDKQPLERWLLTRREFPKFSSSRRPSERTRGILADEAEVVVDGRRISRNERRTPARNRSKVSIPLCGVTRLRHSSRLVGKWPIGKSSHLASI